jgi:hypothetical protein
VDAAQSLATLTALPTEIEQAAIVDPGGVVLAAAPAAVGERLARVAAEVLEARAALNDDLAYVEVGLEAGSVFVVAHGGLTAVATTGPEPASALVLHDLRACLDRTSGRFPGGAPRA